MKQGEIEAKINEFIRPGTFPIAIGFVGADEVPVGFRHPRRDFGHPIPVCQGFSMARRYGWSIAMGAQDHLCTTGAVSLGIVPVKERLLAGEFKLPPWEDNKEARVEFIKNLPKLPYKKNKEILIAPLGKATFEPEVMIIYGNPAQVMLLIDALHKMYEGRPIVSSCSSLVTIPILTKDHNIGLPCPAEHQVAMTQDDELAYAIPFNRAEELVKGLEKISKFGLRYPTTTFLQFQPFFPPGHLESMAYLMEE
jgi:uncharacterized protein (DUF169 family)